MKSIETAAIINENHEIDSDETPTEIVIEGIYQGLYEALNGKTIPLSEMWEGIEAD
jgi:hypothetical protein